MKRVSICIVAALLALAVTAPAFALENQFGGYFRVWMFNNTDFDGQDGTDGFKKTGTEDGIEYGDMQQASSRTRLYYTAVINDDLRFVSAFEMDAVWGDQGDDKHDSFGDVGSDGVSVEVKHSYVDFNYGGANFKLGTQPAVLHRGLFFDDDFSGIVAGMNGFTGIFAKIEENDANMGDDVQLYYASYAFDAGGLKLTPALAYVDAADSNRDTPAENLDHDGDSLWYLGFDADMELGQASLWGTFLYNGGEMDGRDVKALLAAAGFDMGINERFGIHGQSFYASGDDDGDDGDIENFQGIPGQSFYWAEIMGYGVFDEQVSYGSCADRISNIMAANVGVSYAATPRLKFTGDLWYAALAEEDVRGEDELGLEVDLAVDYELVDGLNMKLVAAYLFAGDATTQNADDDENPMEIGTQFCLSF